MIKITALHKYFNRSRENEIHVINGVDLDLPERGMVAILGKSGCGKTTLLNVIGGLDGVAEGRVEINGENIAENTDAVRNRYIGYVFQNYNLSRTESCYDNVASALRLYGITNESEIEQRVQMALSAVGMEKYAKRTPDTLSGGQQQRIAIARAIVKSPAIVLADEPTGNLDEANTVMIMELLRAISKNALVVMVTHEEHLTDVYCDKVIELSDGKVVSVYDNDCLGGRRAEDKNALYLGDMDRRDTNIGALAVECYGDEVEEPVRVRLVNRGGKTYVEVTGATVIDGRSEIKLIDGKAAPVSENGAKEEKSLALPPCYAGGKLGNLFTFRSSVRSGAKEILAATGKEARKAKSRRVMLTLFSIVAVFFSATFGTSLGKLSDVKTSYNSNVFYVYSDTDTSGILSSAVGKSDTGIDYVRNSESLFAVSPTSMLRLYTGSFETFEQFYDFSEGMMTGVVYLGESLIKDLKTRAGSDTLSPYGVAITTAVADKLLEKSTMSYITGYDDLIGLYIDGINIDTNRFFVERVVESDEMSAYVSDMTLARYVFYNRPLSAVVPASDYGIQTPEGEAILCINIHNGEIEYAKAGDTVKIQGEDITVGEVRHSFRDYLDYVLLREIPVYGDSYSWAYDMALSEDPTLVKDSDEHLARLTEIIEMRIGEYLEHYYSYLDSFMREAYLFNPGQIEYWMYVEKGVDEIKYAYTDAAYYTAVKFREANGRYPTMEEMYGGGELSVDFYGEFKTYYQMYENEFYGAYYDTVRDNTSFYLVSDEDYIKLSKTNGDTHPSASYEYAENFVYTVVHSTNPEKTAAWITENLGNIETPESYLEPIVMPDTVYRDNLAEVRGDIVRGAVGLVAMLALMSLCMYLIMRSTLLTRVKEIGVWRAIGVSRKNIVFRFLIESALVCACTVLVGYIGASLFVHLALGASSLAASTFYYPVPLALALLVLLVGITLVFGILPISAMLRKTPSEILAKYDI